MTPVSNHIIATVLHSYFIKYSVHCLTNLPYYFVYYFSSTGTKDGHKIVAFFFCLKSHLQNSGIKLCCLMLQREQWGWRWCLNPFHGQVHDVQGGIGNCNFYFNSVPLLIYFMSSSHLYFNFDTYLNNLLSWMSWCTV